MANIEISTLTRNNDGNSYIIKDANAIPKSGGAVLTGEDYRRTVDGSLLALYGGTAWDNGAFISLSSATRSGDLAGSFILQATTSSSSYKRLIGYPNGTLTWGNKEIDTIEEQGTNYIRYSSGLQICWGSVVNTNNIGTGTTRHSYPVAFSAIPNVVATPNATSQAGPHLVTVIAESETNFIVNLWWTQASQLSSSAIKSHYVAIGKWK